MPTLLQQAGGTWLQNLLGAGAMPARLLVSREIWRRMAIGVFELPARSETGCEPLACPLDATAGHSFEVMSGFRRAFICNEGAYTPVVDGLSPWTIIHAKAHDCVCHRRSGLESYQWGDHRPGDPDSAGGVIISVPLAETETAVRPVYRFVVAASGADKRIDHFTALSAGHRIALGMLLEGIISLRQPMGKTFIIGSEAFAR